MTPKPPATQEEIAQITLQHLQHLQEFRSEFRDFKGDMAEDMKDIKFRLRKIEETLTHHTTQFGRVQERLLRIEHRCQRRSKSRPLERSKNRPVCGVGIERDAPTAAPAEMAGVS